MITINAALRSPSSSRDALVVGLVKDGDGVRVAASPAVTGRALAAVEEAADVLGACGKQGELLRTAGGATGYRVLVLTGLGEDVTPESLRRAAGVATRCLKDLPALEVALPADGPEAVAAIAEGLALGAYRFNRYSSCPEAPAEARILTKDAKAKETSLAITRALILAESVNATRELVNTPAADLYPATFAEHAEEVGKAAGFSVEVWDEKKLEAEGCGGLIGVGRGSSRPPRLVRVEYTAKKARARVALVGKGITFDTGGLSLKPPLSMETMKTDMAGAAAVLHTVAAAARLKLDVTVIGWLALAENMPSGTATRPSDIITIRGGKTVEVLNTDAEGRLVLADALALANEENPDVILDIATLTGAQTIALGNRVAAVMGTEDVRSDVAAAADAAGEEFWPMPLPAQLLESITGGPADLKNKGSREGGMLVAGLFLQEFVKDRPWAHLDIAGPSWADKAWGYTPAGGTGVGVRTMLGYLENVSEE